MPRTRGIAIVVIAVALVCVLGVVAAVTGARVTTLATSLTDLARFTSVVERDVSNTNLDALADDLVQLDTLAQRAQRAAADPVVGATLDGVPVAGPHLAAVRELTSAIVGLTQAARPLSAVLPRLKPESLVQDGHYDVAALRDLDSVMKNLSSELGRANAQVRAIDTSSLHPKVVALIDKAAPALSDARSLVAQLEPLVAVLPILLDSSEQRTWFIGLQNLAEARGTGGIFGAYSVVTTDAGSLELSVRGSDKDLIPVVTPYKGLPVEFIDLWGAAANDWRSINVSPHFPYTGQMVENTWKKYSGQDLDGVLAIGQGTVQYLLAATGPIEIDGTTVDASNVVKFLSLDVYAKYPDATDKNAFVSQLVAEIFSRLQAGKFDLASLLSVAGTVPTADRVLAWSPHDDIEAQIAEAGLDGVLPEAPGPVAAVAVNNGGGNKLEQFLHTTIDYQLGTCNPDRDTRDAMMTITLTNDAPTSGLPAYVTPREDFDFDEDDPVGSNLELVSVYLPVGAADGDTAIDDEEEYAYQGIERERPLLVFSLEINPGQTRTITVPWEEPTVGSDVTDMLSSNPRVLTQASLNPITVSAPAADPCS
jgi:hypothetical protein